MEKITITGVFFISSKQTNSPPVVLDPCNRATCRTTDSVHTDPEWRPLCLALCQVKSQNVTKRLSTAKEWTVPQLSIMIIYNCTWSILIQ